MGKPVHGGLEVPPAGGQVLAALLQAAEEQGEGEVAVGGQGFLHQGGWHGVGDVGQAVLLKNVGLEVQVGVLMLLEFFAHFSSQPDR